MFIIVFVTHFHLPEYPAPLAWAPTSCSYGKDKAAAMPKIQLCLECSWFKNVQGSRMFLGPRKTPRDSLYNLKGRKKTIGLERVEAQIRNHICRRARWLYYRMYKYKTRKIVGVCIADLTKRADKNTLISLDFVPMSHLSSTRKREQWLLWLIRPEGQGILKIGARSRGDSSKLKNRPYRTCLHEVHCMK
jgi:hypothetical protein